MPSRGPALTFDPQYVAAVIDAWSARDLAPMSSSDLEQDTARILRERFVARNIMGMREQTVLDPGVPKAIGLLTTLKLAKKTTKGTGERRVTIFATTPEGRTVLAEHPIGGVLYPRFAECLSKASADISTLLNLFADYGPLHQPVLHTLPEAPRRGAAYQTSVKEGLREYLRHVTTGSTTPEIAAFEPASPKATPPQRLKAAQTWAAQVHPAGALKQLEKLVTICLAFGLLWVDVAQVNEVIGVKRVGLAATKTPKGFLPNVLSWPADSGKIVPALINAIASRANGSGFATIQEVRGALGQRLSLSSAAVDVVLREARDAGDRHEIPIELHFEPDEDQLYAIGRDPLIWRDEAFEFITVLRGSRV